jgi:hypothetical protein
VSLQYPGSLAVLLTHTISPTGLGDGEGGWGPGEAAAAIARVAGVMQQQAVLLSSAHCQDLSLSLLHGAAQELTHKWQHAIACWQFRLLEAASIGSTWRLNRAQQSIPRVRQSSWSTIDMSTVPHLGHSLALMHQNGSLACMPAGDQ